MRYIIGLLLLSTLALSLRPETAQARRITFIRDAEIEDTIRLFGIPLFAVAGLEPSAVRVHLVKDPAINAFVANGQRIFLNTGLLIASDNANQVIGVMAHETGHITGGHLARTHQALQDASANSIMAFVLGAAAIAAGQGQAGSAIIAGGQHVAQRSFLKYSRIQESSADQAALDILKKTGQSAQGMLAFFKKLGDQEALLTASQDPYIRTHPLTRTRLETIQAAVARTRNSNSPERLDFVARHSRMKAKLIAFLQYPADTFRKYPESDRSIAGRFARSIAFHKKRQTQKALDLMSGLIAEYPEDPYFHEFHGQILLESGRPAEAVAPYQRAVALHPDSILLRIGLGQAQVSDEKVSHIDNAIKNLQQAVRMVPDNPRAWRWLGMAYSRNGDIGLASLATAERYFLTGKFRDAVGQATRAERILAKGSPGWLRAQDLKATAQLAAKRRKKN